MCTKPHILVMSDILTKTLGAGLVLAHFQKRLRLRAERLAQGKAREDGVRLIWCLSSSALCSAAS